MAGKAARKVVKTGKRPAGKTAKAVTKSKPSKSKPKVLKAPKPPKPAKSVIPALLSAKTQAIEAPPAKPSKGAAKPAVRMTGDYSISGQIYQKGKLVPGVMHISADTGKILRVVKSQTLGTHFDHSKSVILPGALDIHVHFREPGHT